MPVTCNLMALAVVAVGTIEYVLLTPVGDISLKVRLIASQTTVVGEQGVCLAELRSTTGIADLQIHLSGKIEPTVNGHRIAT